MAGFMDELIAEVQKDERKAERERSALVAYAAKWLGVIADEQQVMCELEYARWNPLLTDRERDLLALRFGVDGARPMALYELAERYNYTLKKMDVMIAEALVKVGPNAMRDYSDARRCRACNCHLSSLGWWNTARGPTRERLKRMGVCSRMCQNALASRPAR